MSNQKVTDVTEPVSAATKLGRDEGHEVDLDIRTIRDKVGSYPSLKDGHTGREFVQTGTDVRTIREKIGLSQREFAALLCISKRTLEGWEQGHRTLNGPARALLTIFKNDPDNAIKALHGAR